MKASSVYRGLLPLVVAVIALLLLNGPVKADDIQDSFKPVWTLVIVHETYHGSSSLLIPNYPTEAICNRHANRAKREGEHMGLEKDSDYLYTDAYCLPAYTREFHYVQGNTGR